MPYKIRFNLGKGKNFRKWKVTDPNGNHHYYDPAKVRLYMDDCVLHNQRGTADKIYSGANKTVCAWVKAKRVTVDSPGEILISGEPISYNPRLAPYWMWRGENVDGMWFGTLATNGRTLEVLFAY